MDRAEIDAEGNGILFYGKANVQECSPVEGQDNVYLLGTVVVLERATQLAPLPGQFYLIRSAKSAVQLDRPISVYRSEVKTDEATGVKVVLLEFLILEKGRGTQELCSLQTDDEIELIGPLGNTFEAPESFLKTNNTSSKLCIIGGGIGVAPVANFASSLPAKKYDFYASFKSGSYGLDFIKADKLVITTDDGSVGIHGMLPAAIDAKKIEQEKYSAVYVCGPTPMLVYVQKICKEAKVPCSISMENRMACGVGACLGCTICTTQGNKRVCKDGPVFDADTIQFEPPVPPVHGTLFGAQSSSDTSVASSVSMPDLSVTIAGVHFNNPVIAASGTFGFGQNYRGLFDVNKLGGICSKGMTLEPRAGNPGQRLVEVTGGLVNSIGLENPGVQHFIDNELPEMMKLKTTSIANLAGGDLDSYVKGAELLDKTNVPMIELNISCPNVKAGGMAFGLECTAASTVVSAVRKVTKKPLVVKLSPNAPDVVGIAMACVKAGADGLSLVNTVQAIAIDIEKGRPVFANIRAGYCGPAIKPLALRMVYDVVQAMNKLPKNQQIPVIGIGGIQCWQDAVEFIMAGASAVEVGTATFSNPNAMVEIIDGLKSFMQRKGFATIEEMKGIAQV
jgi:dihydroorotate dehydrogenase (NAD+) catalytic subunit